MGARIDGSLYCLMLFINFLIISFTVFVMIRLLGKFRRKKEEAPKAPPAPPADVVLLTEIRDLLSAREEK